MKSFRQKPSALVCQFNRPFSIGRLKMNLLPSGGVLGGSSLLVESEATSLLYASLLRTKSIQSVRSMQLKPANILLLNALHSPVISQKVKRKNELERFIESIKKTTQTGQWPTIFCPILGTAQEISYHLSERGIPIRVHPSIQKVNKVYQSFGSYIGESTLYKENNAQESVLLWPLPLSMKGFQRFPKREGPNFIVQKDYSHFGLQIRGIENSFYWNLHADLEEIKQAIVPEIKPKKLIFFGPYAKAYAEECKGMAASVYPIFQNNQPVLF